MSGNRVLFQHCLAIFLLRLAVGLSVAAALSIPPGNSAERNEWNYDDPNEWTVSTKACGGEHQSPINIDPATAINDTDMPKLTFVNYDKAFPENVTNNGHTMMIQLQNNVQNDDMPLIRDGGLSGNYTFHQMHFHWGRNDRVGSEHRIDNQQYPAELHMVHYNSKYGSFAEANKHPDGLAVLAVLIEVEKRDNVAFRHIEHFDNILRPDGNGSASSVVDPIELRDLIPDNPDSFYRYVGSLTTPSCNEAVIWTVFDTPIAVSERQLNQFRHLLDLDGKMLVDNYRPVQSLHDRVVVYRSGNDN